MNVISEIQSSRWLLGHVVSFLASLLVVLLVFRTRCRRRHDAKHDSKVNKHNKIIPRKDKDTEAGLSELQATNKSQNKEEDKDKEVDRLKRPEELRILRRNLTAERKAALKKAKNLTARVRAKDQEKDDGSRINDISNVGSAIEMPNLLPASYHCTRGKNDKLSCEFYKCRTRDVGSNMKRCSRCCKIVYCSKGCQENDWNRHKRECYNRCGI